MVADPLKLAVLRFDAGPTIGAGHALRCISLAEALIDDGWRCAFATNSGVTDYLPVPIPRAVEVVEAQAGATWSAAEIRHRWSEGADLCVIDHLHIGIEFERELEGWAKNQIVFDELMDREHAAQYVICVAPPEGARVGPRVLASPAWSPMRRQFWGARMRRLLRGKSKSELRHIVVSLGGTSQLELIQTILDAIEQSNFRGAVTVVGPDAPALAAEATTRRTPFRLSTLEAVSDMAELLTNTDVAIGACGSSAWERACLAVPSISILTAENQLGVARWLRDTGASIVIESQALASKPLADDIARLLDDDAFRVRMSEIAARLVDGLGAWRLALELSPESTLDHVEVRLRPVQQEDARQLYDWQQDGSTRAYANDTQPVTWDSHVAWLKHKLADVRCLFFLIAYARRPGGALRLDLIERDGEPAFVISIYVAPELKRRGVALAALRAARRLVPGTPFCAEVDPTNAASIALFSRAGFVRVDERWHIAAAMGSEF